MKSLQCSKSIQDSQFPLLSRFRPYIHSHNQVTANYYSLPITSNHFQLPTTTFIISSNTRYVSNQWTARSRKNTARHLAKRETRNTNRNTIYEALTTPPPTPEEEEECPKPSLLSAARLRREAKNQRALAKAEAEAAAAAEAKKKQLAQYLTKKRRENTVWCRRHN